MFRNYVEKNIIPSFNDIIDDIKTIINETEQKCVYLENSELKNKNITLKEKQYMKGNRKSYIKHTRILINNINLPTDYSMIEEIYAVYKENVENFVKQTHRARKILHHFFEHETEAIHNKISELNKQFDKLKSLIEKDEYKKYLELFRNIDEYNNTKEKSTVLKKEIKDKKSLINNTKKNLDKLNEELKEKKNSKPYLKFQEINQNLEEYNNKLGKIKTDVNTKISKFERALKKYEKISMNDSDWIEEYIKNPFDAVTADSNNKGNLILKNMKEKLKNNIIELKNTSKLITNIDYLIDQNYLENKHLEINSLIKNIDLLKKELNEKNISQEIEEIKKQIKSNQMIINDYENEIKELKQSLSEISLDKILENIRIKLSDLMRCNIKFE
ncbi:MAG: hypothetical protein ACOCP8_08380 [archaeon]